jgi:hypothetical protein
MFAFFINGNYFVRQLSVFNFDCPINNESDGIGNATHNTFAKLTWIFGF